MQQRWPRQARIRSRQLEAYPAPIADVPSSWSGSADANANGDKPQDATTPAGELEGVYIISVAARLLEMHPQTLRKYERLGLIQPVRTMGMLRLYSQDDLRKVLLIRHLMDNLGLNLAGVEFALKLVNNLNVFTRRLSRSEDRSLTAERIHDEVSLLCASLSLPAPEPPASNNPNRNAQ